MSSIYADDVFGSDVFAQDVAVKVEAEYSGSWSVRQRVTASFDGAWTTRGLAASAYSSAWTARNIVAAGRAGAWGVRNLRSITFAGAWSVAQSGVAVGSFSGAWTVRRRVVASFGSAWAVEGLVRAYFSAGWSVEADALPEIDDRFVARPVPRNWIVSRGQLMPVKIGPIQLREGKIAVFEFAGEGVTGALSNPVVTVSIVRGEDAEPNDLMVGEPTVVGQEVRQTIAYRVPNVRYLLQATATDESGLPHTVSAYLWARPAA